MKKLILPVLMIFLIPEEARPAELLAPELNLRALEEIFLSSPENSGKILSFKSGREQRGRPDSVSSRDSIRVVTPFMSREDQVLMLKKLLHAAAFQPDQGKLVSLFDQAVLLNAREVLPEIMALFQLREDLFDPEHLIQTIIKLSNKKDTAGLKKLYASTEDNHVKVLVIEIMAGLGLQPQEFIYDLANRNFDSLRERSLLSFLKNISLLDELHFRFVLPQLVSLFEYQFKEEFKDELDSAIENTLRAQDILIEELARRQRWDILAKIIQLDPITYYKKDENELTSRAARIMDKHGYTDIYKLLLKKLRKEPNLGARYRIADIMSGMEHPQAQFFGSLYKFNQDEKFRNIKNALQNRAHISLVRDQVKAIYRRSGTSPAARKYCEKLLAEMDKAFNVTVLNREYQYQVHLRWNARLIRDRIEKFFARFPTKTKTLSPYQHKINRAKTERAV